MNTYEELQVCLKFCIVNKIPCEKALLMLQKSYGEAVITKAEVYDRYNAMEMDAQLPENRQKISCISSELEMPRMMLSDSESEYHDGSDKTNGNVRRQVGRPSTGAINLNIVRTGRGQGRPTKASIIKRQESTVEAISKPANKRGRPTKGGSSYIPTGKPRGRPKSVNLTDTEQVKAKCGNGDESGDENSLKFVEIPKAQANRGRPKNVGKRVSFPGDLDESNISKDENVLDKECNSIVNIIIARTKVSKPTRGRPSKIKNSDLKEGKARGRPKLSNDTAKCTQSDVI